MSWYAFLYNKPVYLIGAIPLILLACHELYLYSIEATQPWGCKKLGLTGPSSLEDEEDDSKYASGTDPDSWRVKAMLIHPIKSCFGVEVDGAEIEAAGVRYDRKFAFAEWVTNPIARLDALPEEKEPRWEFRTLRNDKFKQLTLVRPEVWIPDRSVPPSKHEDYVNNMASQGVLVLKYPWTNPTLWQSCGIRLGLLPAEKSFRVPLYPPKGHNYIAEKVKIWKDFPVWLNYARHLPSDFKDFLGARNDVTLFRADPSSFRQVFRNAPKKEQLGYQPIVGFADSYPLHLLNLASVRDIAAKVKYEIPHFSARRFRPNFLISGPPAYDEDDWKRVRIGGNEYHCACHTVRCKLPNVDPDTAVKHKDQPHSTLISFRNIDPGDKNNPCLGLQLVPAVQKGMIKVGDKIEVLERGEHVYIKM